MKIVILGSAHPLRGGLASYNERLAREFQSQGHEVIIYTFSLQYPSFLFPGKSQYSDAPKPGDLNIRVKVNSINPLNWLLVGREIKKLMPDILVTKFWLPFMGPCLGTICRIVKGNGKTKVVTIIDNIIPHEKRVGDKPFAQYFVGGVDAAITMSMSVAEDFKSFNRKKPVMFSPHPIFDNFGEGVSRTKALEVLDLDPSFNYILFFGFIRDYKGLDILLKAMADERLKGRKLKAIVAGEFYSDSKPYLDLIKELGIEDKVVLATDFIPDDRVKYYFCAADIVVQPYKHATQSGVTQICYHFNKPMLVTNVGGLPELVPHNKVGYVTPVEPAAIAEAIVNFYDANRAIEFENNIKEEKKKYGWDVMAAKVIEITKKAG